MGRRDSRQKGWETKPDETRDQTPLEKEKNKFRGWGMRSSLVGPTPYTHMNASREWMNHIAAEIYTARGLEAHMDFVYYIPRRQNGGVFRCAL